MQVTGDLRLGEADSASTAIYIRMAGFAGRVMLAASCTGPGIVGLGGLLLLSRMGKAGESLILPWVGFTLIIAYLPLFVQFLARRATRSAQLARGAQQTTLCRFNLDDAGMRMDWDGAEHWCAWGKVSEVFLCRNMWVVVSGLGYCVPRRLFPDQEAEAAFLEFVLSRLTPEALERSWDATLVRNGDAKPWTGYGKTLAAPSSPGL
ncbi:MAG: hypothetical protein GC145_01075 [Caulobacter sp.]|nr:hypothetical protein [Caulobacter sp.]